MNGRFNPTLLLFLIGGTIFLTFSFYGNNWNVVEPSYYHQWERTYERVVIARLAMSEQTGIFTGGGLLGPANEFGFQKREVFSACPTAALYLREDFLSAGGFDENYFSYFEDVDLGFRLRLAGKKCLYVPEAVVHHVGSASTGKRSDFSVYYGYRNMIWTFFKNMPSPLIWFFLPVHVVTLMFFVVYLSIRGQGKVILRAVRDAVRGLPGVLEKRKVIQKNKKIKPSELLKVMSTGLLEPYREFVFRNRTK